ncbi:hypothetical protein PO124_34980 [Bacillus licheniformis]|nr:hypothetical protein [Bacillus licheniformis]
MDPQRETVNQLIEDIQTLNADNAKRSISGILKKPVPSSRFSSL